MKRVATQLLISVFALLLSSAAAQNAAQPSQRTIVKAGHLLDVKSGKTLSGQVIVIEGGKIVSVGPVGEVAASATDQIIDLPNATVLPGLIDAHTHLTGDPKDVGYESLAISVPR